MVFVRTKKIKATSCLLWKCYWVLNRQNTFKSIWHTNGLAASRTQSCNKHTWWIPLQKNLFVHFSTSTDSYCESIIKGLDIKKVLYLGSSGEMNICCKIIFFWSKIVCSDFKQHDKNELTELLEPVLWMCESPGYNKLGVTDTQY